MKKTLKIVLIFVLALAVLLGVAALVERLRPEEPSEAAEEESAGRKEKVLSNEMTPDSATAIQMEGDRVSFLGVGAEFQDGTVTIAYPGTYRLSGELNGQIAVDLGDFDGVVYLLLDGVNVSSTSGPALHVKQADQTVLVLGEDTENRFADGEGYTVDEGTVQEDGAAVYCADDMMIQGEGTLIVTGRTADGLRCKDTLTVTGGALWVYAADDGIQSSDELTVTGSELHAAVYGDGLKTTKGGIGITDSALEITAGGDGADAMTELIVTDSRVNVTAYGGPAYYAEIVVNDLSAKGLKAAGNISVSGGILTLNTADDGVHGDGDVTLSGVESHIASGDDALCAEGTLTLLGGTADVTGSYEALEGGSLRLTDAAVTAAAENNGLSAGEGGVTAENSVLVLTAPRAVSADSDVALRGGSLTLTADGTDSLFKTTGIEIVGTTVLAAAPVNDRELLLKNGEIDGAMLFLFRDAVTAGTGFVLADSAGNTVLTFALASDAKAVLLHSGALREGETYTLTAGETVLTGTAQAEGCAVIEPEGGLTAQQTGWGPGGGFPGGGFPGGPRR